MTIELDVNKLFEEAKALSSAEHLAAIFNCSVEDLIPYKHVIERARLVSEHEFMSRLRDMVIRGEKDAIKLWADMAHLTQIDKTLPTAPEDMMTAVKAREILTGSNH